MPKIEQNPDGTVTLVELDPAKIYYLIVDSGALPPLAVNDLRKWNTEHGFQNVVIITKRPRSTIDIVEAPATGAIPCSP